MLNAKQLGDLGEGIACDDLHNKGYKILLRKYVFQKAEVDIIAEYDDKIIFVEVKTRNSSYLTDPTLLVPIGKQKQIIKAADRYVKDNFAEPEKEWRFDIMIIVTNSEYTTIEHIEDAFYPMV